MIFLYYNHNDKPFVDQFAYRIADIFGSDNVFYDTWSMQPGDGIIDKMNEGLSKCKYFFFFVSNNSLMSKMVSLEWQNALMQTAKGQVRFVPVKIDDCSMPVILLQTLYIDAYSQGLEVGVRRMVDVINGVNNRPQLPEFHNVQAYVKREENKLSVEIRAEHYLEPMSDYILLFDSEIDGNSLEVGIKEDSMYFGGLLGNVTLNDGKSYSGVQAKVSRGTLPGFPVTVQITPRNGMDCPSIRGVMRAVGNSSYQIVPVHMKMN